MTNGTKMQTVELALALNRTYSKIQLKIKQSTKYILETQIACIDEFLDYEIDKQNVLNCAEKGELYGETFEETLWWI